MSWYNPVKNLKILLWSANRCLMLPQKAKRHYTRTAHTFFLSPRSLLVVASCCWRLRWLVVTSSSSTITICCFFTVFWITLSSSPASVVFAVLVGLSMEFLDASFFFRLIVSFTTLNFCSKALTEAVKTYSLIIGSIHSKQRDVNFVRC